MTKPQKHPLKRWRFENDKTLDAVSSQIGVAKSYLSDVENLKRSPSARVLKKLIRLTGIAIEEFGA